VTEKYILYSIIFVSLILTFSIAIHYKLPIGEDISFHLEMAKEYYFGKWMMNDVDSDLMGNIGIPYPPLLHFILLLGFLLKIPLTFPLLIQLFLYPLALYTTGMLVHKELSLKHSIIVLLLLASSYGFFDRTVQVQPQSFDMILFPLSIYFFLKKNTSGFMFSNCIMVYTHSYYSLFLFGSFVLFSLFRRDRIKMVIFSFITFLPIIIITLPYIISTLQYMVSTNQNIQEVYIVNNPLFLLGYLGGVSAFVLLVLVRYKSINLKDDFQLLLLCWIVCLLPLMFVMDRLITYMVVPFSILASIVIFKIDNRYIRMGLIGFVVMISILYMGTYFQKIWLDEYHIDTEHLMEIARNFNS